MKTKKSIIFCSLIVFLFVIFTSCSSNSSSDESDSSSDIFSDVITASDITTEDSGDIQSNEENSIIENSDGTQKVYNIDKANKSEETKLTPQEQENLKQEILNLIDQLKENE